MTPGPRVWLYDTTLRDGAQTAGVDFSVADKTTLALALDDLGIDYVEGGWPGANPTDDAFFADAPILRHGRFTAFGMTRRAGRSAANDPGLAGLLNSGAPAITIFGKTWDFHVDIALGIEHAENLAMIRDSLAHVGAQGREPLFDAEHFFDGYKANPDFALACLEAAAEGGARWIVLCDTNGGTLPHEIEAIVATVAERIPGDRLGIHCHDDTGNAVANSLAAVRAGARMVQGTLNGLGERCGNANLVSILPTLALKMGYETGVGPDRLTHLSRLSRLLDERLNREPDSGAPYVGAGAFAHKGGVHVSAVEKDPRSYEHIAPELVGNHRHIVVSNQSGRSNILARFREIGLELEDSQLNIPQLLEEVKAKEFQGYAYDGAEASFELLARRALGEVPDYFRVRRFRVIDERRRSARGEWVTESEATVIVDVGSRECLEVAFGNGPVNALDLALRKALAEPFPTLADLELVDYKVRILTHDGTGAVTRVMIESRDRKDRWVTVGVSANIIDASFKALEDSLVYKLFHDGVGR